MKEETPREEVAAITLSLKVQDGDITHLDMHSHVGSLMNENKIAVFAIAQAIAARLSELFGSEAEAHFTCKKQEA